MLVDLVHLMCRNHVQSGSPRRNDMLANSFNTPRRQPCAMWSYWSSSNLHPTTQTASREFRHEKLQFVP